MQHNRKVKKFGTMSDIMDKNILKKHLKCKVCLKDFKKPRILECLHVFCESCVYKHISITDKEQEIVFTCPLCGNKTKPAYKQTILDIWIKSFPICHAINNLVVQSDCAATSSYQQNYNDCDHCRAEGVVSKPFAFCTDCVEYYCKTCYESHRKFKVTRSHYVLKDTDIPSEAFLFQRSLNYRVCTKHPNEKNEFACPEHNEIFCGLCARSVHINCESTVRLDTVSHEQNEHMLVEYKSKINKLLSTTTDQLTTKLNDFERTEIGMSKIKGGLLESLTYLQTLSEYLDKDIAGKLKERNLYQNELIGDCIVKSTTFVDKINKTLELAGLISKYGLKIHAIVLQDSFKQTMLSVEEFLQSQTNHQDSMKQLLTEKVKVMQQSMINVLLTKLDDIIQYHEMERLPFATSYAQNLIQFDQTPGKAREQTPQLPAKEHKKDTKECMKTSTVACLHGNKCLADRDVRKTAEYDLSIPSLSDKPACHSAAVILDDGNMVFIDKNNKVLKYVCSEFKVKFYEKLQTEPKDITYVNEKLVVAFSNEVIMFIIDVKNGHFLKSERHKTDNTLVSVCAVNNSLVLLYSTNKYSFIQLRDKRGQVTWTIDFFVNKYGWPCKLTNSRLLRSCGENKYMICQEKSVKCFGEDGTQLWSWFADYSVRGFCYIALDSEKNLYLCDADADTIHRISASHPMRSRIIVSNIHKPATVMYSKGINALVIGCINDNKVHICEFI